MARRSQCLFAEGPAAALRCLVCSELPGKGLPAAAETAAILQGNQLSLTQGKTKKF